MLFIYGRKYRIVKRTSASCCAVSGWFAGNSCLLVGSQTPSHTLDIA
jgi:hypothetical protein